MEEILVQLERLARQEMQVPLAQLVLAYSESLCDTSEGAFTLCEMYSRLRIIAHIIP
jgi:hypothetical protein